MILVHAPNPPIAGKLAPFCVVPPMLVSSDAPATQGGLNGIAALLTLDGGDGTDVAALTAATATAAGTLTDNLVTGLGMAGIAYDRFEDLGITLGGAANTFTIDATHEGTTTLNTGGGIDTVHVNGILSPTTINTTATPPKITGSLGCTWNNTILSNCEIPSASVRPTAMPIPSCHSP